MAFLVTAGVIAYFFSATATLVLYSFWIFVVAFTVSFVPTDYVVRRFARSERTRRISFVYGMLVGGLVSNIFLHLFLTYLPPLNEAVAISIVVALSVLTPTLSFWYYEARPSLMPSEQTAGRGSTLRRVGALVFVAVVLIAGAAVVSALYTPVTDFSQPVNLGPLSLDYPSCSTTMTCIGAPSGTLHVDIYLHSDHAISEGTPVELTVTGSIGSDLMKNVSTLQLGNSVISLIKVGFEGAYQTSGNAQLPSYGPPAGGTLMLVNSTAPCAPSLLNYGPTRLCGIPTTISWPIQGDYYPIITIFFTDGAVKTQPYPSYTVHVIAAAVIQSENINLRDAQVSIDLGVALVLLASIEAIKLGWDIATSKR